MRRIVDRRVLHLINIWLECAVEESDPHGRSTRSTTAKDASRSQWTTGTLAEVVGARPKLTDGQFSTSGNSLSLGCAEVHERVTLQVAKRAVEPERRGVRVLRDDAALPRVYRYIKCIRLCLPIGVRHQDDHNEVWLAQPEAERFGLFIQRDQIMRRRRTEADALQAPP